MNWKKRFDKLKPGDIVKPKPKNQIIYKYYGATSPINCMKQFTLDTVYLTDEDGVRWFGVIGGNKLGISEQDVIKV